MMTEQLLHLQRWIISLEQQDDGWHCEVGYTITNSREETLEAIQSTPLAAARFAYKLAKAHYEDRRDNYYLKEGYVETDNPLRTRGVYERKRNRHLLAWTGRAWHCQKCDDTMYYLPGKHSEIICPGVKRYRRWDDIPENLKTPNQLYELGYSKGKTKLPEPEGAIAWRNEYKRKSDWQWVYLYPVEKAVKRNATKSQLKALGKAHRAKGSTIEIIKAVTDILPPEYTVVSEYKSFWGYKYTLKITLNSLTLYDSALTQNKKKAIGAAKVVARTIADVSDLYLIAEPLADWSKYEIDIYKREFDNSIVLSLALIDEWEDTTHRYPDIETAKRNIARDIEVMKQELTDEQA